MIRKRWAQITLERLGQLVRASFLVIYSNSAGSVRGTDKIRITPECETVTNQRSPAQMYSTVRAARDPNHVLVLDTNSQCLMTIPDQNTVNWDACIGNGRSNFWTFRSSRYVVCKVSILYSQTNYTGSKTRVTWAFAYKSFTGSDLINLAHFHASH
jgi:hypothetical protein